MVSMLSGMSGGDPFQFIGVARAAGPVMQLMPNLVAVLGHEACLAALRDSGAWSSAAMTGFQQDGRRQGLGLTMIGADPPDHTRLRTLVSHAFTPRRVAALEPRIAALAEELLDAVPAGEPWDLMDAYAEPLPVTIIAEMLGIPASDRRQFKKWSDDLVSLAGVTQGEVAPERLESRDELGAYLREQLEMRRRKPTDDLIGGLIAAEEAGDRLTADEALATCVLLLIAGNETTTNLIGNAIAALNDVPEQFAAVRAHPSLIPAAIDETLRFAPPALTIFRVATRKMEFFGKEIEAGTAAFIVLAAANRDASVFPDPDRFDIHRDPARNLAFGHGIHYCLGAPLAKLEARVGLEALFRRFPNLRRADGGPVERLSSFILYGPKRLMVTG